MDLGYRHKTGNLTGETGEEPPSCELSARQCLFLECLSEQRGRAQLVELSRRYAARARGCQPDSVPDSMVRRCYVELAATVVEHLEQEGLIDYCEEAGIVRSRLRTE